MNVNDPTLPAAVGGFARRAFAVGAVLLAGSIAGGIARPDQFFRSYLLAFVFWNGLAVGSLAVLMLQYLTGGAWGIAIRRELEAATRMLWLTAIAFLPLMGIGQGVEILVGRRQGEGRPDLSAKTTWTGLRLALGYAVVVSVLYAAVPWVFTWPFGVGANADEWEQLRPVVHTLLLFVALYTVGDAVNVTVSYALRGAGDTRFVAWVAVVVAWPVMVIPTWIAATAGWGVYGAWVCACV